MSNAKKVIDAFVFNMLSILQMTSVRYETYTNTIRLFSIYLQNDSKVYKKFKDSMTQLKEIKISNHLEVGKQNDK